VFRQTEPPLYEPQKQSTHQAACVVGPDDEVDDRQLSHAAIAAIESLIGKDVNIFGVGFPSRLRELDDVRSYSARKA